MFIIYCIDLSTKKIKCKDRGSYFYKNKKNRRKQFFFRYFISEIPNISYVRFIRKCLSQSFLFYFRISENEIPWIKLWMLIWNFECQYKILNDNMKT